MKNRTRLIVVASWTGIITNLVLAVLKITGGFVAESWAVIGDGIDTTADIATFIITLITIRIASRPPNSKYPYGYDRAETVATKFLAFIIFFAGAQLLFTTSQSLFRGEHHAIPSVLAIYVTVISIVGKLILAVWMHRQGQLADSPMLQASAKNMKADIILSVAVLISILLAVLMHLTYADTIMAILVSLWIMKIAFGIFMETSLELMDGVKDISLYKRVFEAVNQVKGAHNPHRARIRKMANMFVVDIDIEVDADLKVRHAHKIGELVEESIKQNVENIYDIMIHIEPLGNVEKEKYGLTRKDV